jgi:hypothetical protein
MKEYRVIRYKWVGIGVSYLLQQRRRFLWWKFWLTLAEDPVGIFGPKWAERYHCPIIDDPSGLGE